MVNKLDYLIKEKDLLQKFVIKYGDKLEKTSLSSVTDDLNNINDLIKTINDFDSLVKSFVFLLNSSDESDIIIKTINDKFNINLLDILNNNESKNNDSIEDIETDNQNIETNEQNNQEITFTLFNVNEEWNKIDQEEKNKILASINNINNIGISKLELKLLEYISETKVYIINDIIKGSGNDYLKIQASIDGLVDKNLLRYDNNNQSIFLTKLGAWFYGLVNHKDSWLV